MLLQVKGYMLKKIIHLLKYNKDRLEFGQRLRKTVIEKYNWELNTQKVIEYIKRFNKSQ